MAQEWAVSFYNSKAWIKTRKLYLDSIYCLCERCLKKGLYIPAVVVHHKEYLTIDNINDYNISLSFDNLEGLCMTCHQHEHYLTEDDCTYGLGIDYIFDSMGNVVPMVQKEETPP